MTNEQMEDQERTEFEAWATREHFCIEKTDIGLYAEDDTFAAWVGFQRGLQSARRSQGREVPEGWVLRRMMPSADVDDPGNERILRTAGECGFAYDGMGQFMADSAELIAFGKALIAAAPDAREGRD
jgi:hypothetical protein